MTPEQQRRLNAMCGDLAKQVTWSVRINGVDHPTKLHRDDWRHMFSGIRLGDRIAPHPESPGRFITLSASSLRLTDEDASFVIDMIGAFGDDHDVIWSDPKERALREQYAAETHRGPR